MLFTSYVLGFIALATAAPSVHPARVALDLAEREADTPAARGLTWTPRSVEPRKQSGNSYNNLGIGSKGNNFAAEEIIILQLQEQVLAQELLIAEIELSRVIKEELKLKQELLNAKDNIRRNTFKNQNNNQNVVIVIITEIIDNRNSKNSNKRYMSRQIQNNSNNNNNNNKNINNDNNNNNNDVVFVVIVEAAQITIGSNLPSKTRGPGKATRVRNAAQSTGTGESTPSIGTYIPSEALAVQDGISILPSGVPSPQFSNGKQSSDPAIIMLEEQTVFVQESGKSNSFDVTLLNEVSISN